MTMRSQEEDITPARALKDLETARCGRRPSQKVIGDYARDMFNGDWHLTHQGVAYSPDCILRDGQQRYWAVIKAATDLAEAGVIASADDFSVRMMVAYDVPEESFPFFDGGKIRSLSDTWFAEGEQATVLLQSIVRRIAMWEAGNAAGTVYRPTRAEQMAVLVKHPEARDAAAFADGWRLKPCIPTPGVAGFLWWYLARVTDEATRDFFMEGLRTGGGLSEKDDTKPVLLLRNRLGRDFYEAKRAGTSLKPETTLYLCLRGFLAWRRKEDISKLQMPKKLTEQSFETTRRGLSKAR